MEKRRFPRIHVGMRTIKTSIAVMICLTIGQITDSTAPPLIACVATILTMRETVDKSIAYGVTRILATLFGAAVGMLILLFQNISHSPLVWLRIPVAGIGVIITIQLSVMLKRPDTSAIAAVALLLIALSSSAGNLYLLALRRIIETVAGIIVAIIVNKFFSLRYFKKTNPPDSAADS